MWYSYEPPREEQHCLSVWGDEAKAICVDDGFGNWDIRPDVRIWMIENKDTCHGVLGGMTEDGLHYTFRFATKDAAMLFKLRFHGTES